MARPQRETAMPPPLLDAKPFLPRLRDGLVPRLRLNRRLDRGGPAGRLAVPR